MSLMLELRTTALSESNVLLRKQMKDCADQIQKAISVFYVTSCNETLAELQGHWSRGLRLLSFKTPIDTGGGTRKRKAA